MGKKKLKIYLFLQKIIIFRCFYTEIVHIEENMDKKYRITL